MLVRVKLTKEVIDLEPVKLKNKIMGFEQKEESDDEWDQ